MKFFKIYILFYFLKHRFHRLSHANKVSAYTINKWHKNLDLSPFYKKYKSSKESFPIINKAIFMNHFNTINTLGISKEEAFNVALKSEHTRDFNPTIGNISVGLSSGTSGNKGMFLVSPKERAIWVGAILDRVIGFSLKKRKVAFFLRANNNLYESVKSKLLAFHFFDIISSIKDHVEKLIDIKPNILIAQPSVLFEIAKIFEQNSISVKFDKVISVAEVLEDDLKIYLESVFLVKLEQVYQATEGFLAHTCKHGKLHFNEDWLRIEKKYIDSEKIRFYPIITDYLRTTQPLVRYALNDIIHEGKPCSCGMKSMVIEKIEGRSDDVFVFIRETKRIIVFPDFIRRAVMTCSDQILNYKVTQKSNDRVTFALEIQENASEVDLHFLVKKTLNKFFNNLGIEQLIIDQEPIIFNPMKKFKRINNENT